MKRLSEYINEALKTVKSVRGEKIENYNYDIVQVIDRNFKEGITDDDFRKFIKQDIDEVFKLKSAQLNKDYDSIIDELVEKEVEAKLSLINKWAESKYKRQSARDKYIEDSKEEIRQRIIKTHPAHEIDEIEINFSSLVEYIADMRMFICKDKPSSFVNRKYKWDNKAIDVMLEDFDEQFTIQGNGTEKIKLRDGVIGWTISYTAYNGSTCPKRGRAILKLKLNKETEKIVKNKSARDADINIF